MHLRLGELLTVTSASELRFSHAAEAKETAAVLGTLARPSAARRSSARGSVSPGRARALSLVGRKTSAQGGRAAARADAGPYCSFIVPSMMMNRRERAARADSSPVQRRQGEACGRGGLDGRDAGAHRAQNRARLS